MPATRGRGRASRAATADVSPPSNKPRSDAYTGLLVISLLAMLTGTVLLYLDYAAYGDQKAPPLPSRPAAVPPPAGGNQPVPPAQGAGAGAAAPGNVPPAPGQGNQPPPAPGNNPMPPQGGGAAPPMGNPPGGGNNPMPPQGGGAAAPPKE
jgi:hypothetical protein